MDHTEAPDPETWSTPWLTPWSDPWSGSGSGPTEDYELLFCDRSPVRSFRTALEPALFWTVAAVGLMGNLLVLWVYLCRGRGLCKGRGLTHLYLLHLCAADLLFLLTLPLWAQSGTAGWIYGEALCKATTAVYKVNLFSVSLFLACISVDRYVVIVHPTVALNSQMRRQRWARIVSVSMWLLAVILAAPELAFTTVIEQDGLMTCRTLFPAYWGRIVKATVLSLQVAVGFFLPLVVMAVCYAVIGRRLLLTRTFHKHRPLVVVMAIVLVFIVTQLPHSCVLIAEIWDAHSAALTDCETRKVLDKAGLVLRALAYSHPALNPFLYALIGRRFRQEVSMLLQRSGFRKKVFLSKPRPRTLSDCDTSQGLSL
ncbi:unnamed protein product [Knipowitschia caucasica]|uniref:G-protein coupled receptors family 1 profile domain-containing protein n=2 Tax=Knipowitschia caucasica TaxID=637954 RepID=A0AAV2JZ55_KNICA